MPVPAVVFDFDGVLADTEGLHLEAFQEAFAARGWTLTDAAYAERYLGYDDRTTVVRFAADHGFTVGAGQLAAVMRDKARVFERLRSSGSVLYPAAPACIRALTARFPLAIASGSLREEITSILNGAGLLDAFRGIVSAEDVARSKPAPDGYLRAAALLGARPQDCVAIEDSHWGVAAARTAGMKTIALTTTMAAASLSAADRILASLAELTPEIVDALAGRGRA
jgi:HAD superfamily hydrolase (TIGR01509 family)